MASSPPAWTTAAGAPLGRFPVPSKGGGVRTKEGTPVQSLGKGNKGGKIGGKRINPGGKRNPVGKGGKGGVGTKKYGARPLAKDLTSEEYIKHQFKRGGIRKVTRRGGIKYISGPWYDAFLDELIYWLEQIAGDSLQYCDNRKHIHIGPEDIAAAIERQGQKLLM